MELSKTIYTLKKLRNMCVAFEDARGIEALDTAMGLVEAELATEKARLLAFVQVRPEPGFRGADMRRRT